MAQGLGERRDAGPGHGLLHARTRRLDAGGIHDGDTPPGTGWIMPSPPRAGLGGTTGARATVVAAATLAAAAPFGNPRDPVPPRRAGPAARGAPAVPAAHRACH